MRGESGVVGISEVDGGSASTGCVRGPCVGSHEGSRSTVSGGVRKLVAGPFIQLPPGQQIRQGSVIRVADLNRDGSGDRGPSIVRGNPHHVGADAWENDPGSPPRFAG